MAIDFKSLNFLALALSAASSAEQLSEAKAVQNITYKKLNVLKKQSDKTQCLDKLRKIINKTVRLFDMHEESLKNDKANGSEQLARLKEFNSFHSKTE